MNDLDIFCFTSVARTKSFSITARELRISQQAVSKHIKNLEEEFGYPLFFRDHFTTELTKAGIYLLEYFSKRDRIIQDMKKDFESLKPNSSLTIGLSQWTKCPDWVINRLNEFRINTPESELRLLDLDANEALTLLREGNIDMLFTTRYMTRYLPARWKCIEIAALPIYLIMSRRSPYTSDQLFLYPFYTVFAGEEDENQAVIRVRRTCAKLGFTPQNITVCHDMGSVMLNVLLNSGLTLGCYPPDRGNPKDYKTEKTDLKAEFTLCCPRHSTNPYLHPLEEYIAGGIINAKDTY